MSDKTILPLLNGKTSDTNHHLFKEDILENETSEFEVSDVIAQPQAATSVWPSDSDIQIERASFEGEFLTVEVNNLSFEKIGLTAIGAKYTPDNNENIGFVPSSQVLSPGVNIIKIPVVRNPYKFVIRTNRKTGSGTTRDSLNW